MQRNPSIWVCFFTYGVLQNGYILRTPTHTSGHFSTGVAPPPPPGVKSHYLSTISVNEDYRSIWNLLMLLLKL